MAHLVLGEYRSPARLHYNTVMRRSKTNLPEPAILPDAAWQGKFRRRLFAWFRRHARDLPWRRSRDPYAVWISEIMLQQTQVATVGPYFERFLARFPGIAALAGAEEQDVLRLWEGLGYYRRARQLHLAARRIVEQHGGLFPRDMDAVRGLPGIGRYTAGAILSIAFDARAPCWKRTRYGFTAGSWRTAEILLRPRETGCCGPWPKPSSRGGTAAR